MSAARRSREAEAQAPEFRAAEVKAAWLAFAAKIAPFARVASADLPLSRLLRLSLFQVAVGMGLALTTGALNRVMIVELGVPAWLVAAMIAAPVLVAPARALIGHRSDGHRSAFGWRRAPYIWFGAMLQFGGLAVAPFALLILSGDAAGGIALFGEAVRPETIGAAAAGLSFLLIGAGVHTTQTAGLALACDVVPASARPRAVALLYVALLLAMTASALVFGWLLNPFTPVRLIQIVQGAAVLTLILNAAALWRQEGRSANERAQPAPTRRFADAWSELAAAPGAIRALVAVALGAAAFGMQDVLLEPYGGEALGLTVSETTMLTALIAAGGLAGFAVAAQRLTNGAEPHRLASVGLLVGVLAFAAVILAEPIRSVALFRVGVALAGFGGGVFSVCTLVALMAIAKPRGGRSPIDSGLTLGAWGAAQATAAGAAAALGGALRDGLGALAEAGRLGPAFSSHAAGYVFVYHLEILLLFATLAAIGPLARHARSTVSPSPAVLPAYPA
ncbi:MAG: MFS transporter [Parvularculaceae bacterium]